MVFALLGFLLSFAAQGGGIGPVNGFIAPVLGPWSGILEPNAIRLRDWKLNNQVFAVGATLVVAASVMLSAVPERKAWKILLKLVAHVAVAFWCLCGIGKVILELS